MIDETLAERLEDLARLNEGTAKWMIWISSNDEPESPELQKLLGELRAKSCAVPAYRYQDVMWQTARLLNELVKLAKAQGHDTRVGEERIRRALLGTLYEKNEGNTHD